MIQIHVVSVCCAFGIFCQVNPVWRVKAYRRYLDRPTTSFPFPWHESLQVREQRDTCQVHTPWLALNRAKDKTLGECVASNGWIRTPQHCLLRRSHRNPQNLFKLPCVSAIKQTTWRSQEYRPQRALQFQALTRWTYTMMTHLPYHHYD